MCILSITYSASPTRENKKIQAGNSQRKRVCVSVNSCILICKIFWAEIAAILIITTTIIIKKTPTKHESGFSYCRDFGNEGRTIVSIHQNPTGNSNMIITE